MSNILPKNKKKLVSISEAAKFLGISIDTVRRWDRTGILHSIRVDGKNRYFDLKELENHKSSKLLSISEASTKLGISLTTLRRLEKKALLVPKRNKAGERLYTKKSLETFQKSDYFKRKKSTKSKSKNINQDYIIEKKVKGEFSKSISGKPISATHSPILDKTPSRNAFWDRATEVFALTIVFILLTAIGITNIKVVSAEKASPPQNNQVIDPIKAARVLEELKDSVLSAKELEDLENKKEETPDTPTMDYIQSLLEKASEYKTEDLSNPSEASEESKLGAEGGTIAGSSVILSIITHGADSIDIREKASTDSAKIGEALDGENYEMISRIPQWYQIKLNNSSGFIPEEYAQIKEIK